MCSPPHTVASLSATWLGLGEGPEFAALLSPRPLTVNNAIAKNKTRERLTSFNIRCIFFPRGTSGKIAHAASILLRFGGAGETDQPVWSEFLFLLPLRQAAELSKILLCRATLIMSPCGNIRNVPMRRGYDIRNVP